MCREAEQSKLQTACEDRLASLPDLIYLYSQNCYTAREREKREKQAKAWRPAHLFLRRRFCARQRLSLEPVAAVAGQWRKQAAAGKRQNRTEILTLTLSAVV